MRRSVLIFAACGALVAGLGLWAVLGKGPQANALQVRTLATRVLAEALVKKHAGRRVLVISNPFVRRAGVDKAIAATEEAGLRGLREGFGTALPMTDPAFPELKAEAERDPRSVPIDPETTTPMSYLVGEQAFDRLASAHPDCDLIVSLIGLPVALDRVRCWQQNGPPKFGLLLPDVRMIGDAAAVRQVVKSGKLVAFVLAKPNAPTAEATLSSDLAAEFEKRFVLVTVENIDQVIRTYPKLFPGE